jgi:hypothetical protein
MSPAPCCRPCRMRIDARLLLALALSLLLHALVAGSRGWRLPFLEEPEPAGTLEAHLALKPAAAPLPQPALPPPTPRPARAQAPPRAGARRAARRGAGAGRGALAGRSRSAGGAAAGRRRSRTGASAGRLALAAARVASASSVTRGEGEQATLVGESTHTWRHDGATYSVQHADRDGRPGGACSARPGWCRLSEGTPRRGKASCRAEFRVERMRQGGRAGPLRPGRT